MTTRAWLLNLDADFELDKPLGYAPTDATRRRMAALAEDARDLLRPGDVLLAESAESFAVPDEAEGCAWCVTPRVRVCFERLGIAVVSAPSFDIICRVNHREFAAELGQTLPGACFTRERFTIETMLREHPVDWLFKRPHGFSGRGHRRALAGQIDPALSRWLDASLARDGLQCEPLVKRERDFVQHGYVSQDGVVTLGQICVQVCARDGAWRQTRRAVEGELTDEERALLCRTVEQSAEALRAAGYYGAFGLDAYRYRASDGALRFNPRSEINARYTMGWALGMGKRRPPEA